MAESRVGGAWRTIAAGEAYAAGAWRTLTRGEAYVAGAWREIFNFALPDLVVATSPSSASGIVHPTNFIAVTVTSNVVTATVTGGIAPFTYHWTVLSGAFAITNPGGASTAFVAYVEPGLVSGDARCTVTDSTGVIGTVDVHVALRNSPTV